MKKGIAFFDFDGTITTRDTFIEFIRFVKGNFRLYFGFLLHIHWLIGFKLKIISNQKAKERMLEYFFGGADEKQFRDHCHSFNNEKLPSLIRPKAIEEITRLKSMDYVVVIVSASPEEWIIPFAEQFRIELIASRLEVVQGKITGRLLGKNCHGPEKVARIKERYQLDEFDDVYAFGDSGGDRDMLKMAANAFYKPFRSK